MAGDGVLWVATACPPSTWFGTQSSHTIAVHRVWLLTPKRTSIGNLVIATQEPCFAFISSTLVQSSASCRLRRISAVSVFVWRARCCFSICFTCVRRIFGLVRLYCRSFYLGNRNFIINTSSKMDCCILISFCLNPSIKIYVY